MHCVRGDDPIVKHNVETHGQHIVWVGDGGFSYTIGNALIGLPELLLLGQFPPSFIQYILNAAHTKMVALKDAPDVLDIGANFPLRLRDTSPIVKDKYTAQVGMFLGHEEYSVRQVMLCDKHGVYPDQPGCAFPFNVLLV